MSKPEKYRPQRLNLQVTIHQKAINKINASFIKKDKQNRME
jgi:hypothetical protein